MPGVYLIAILVSAAGIAALDARWRLAAWDSPARTAVAVLLGTAFFLAWDAVGIATGVFVKGDSPLLLGVDLAPELPVEEPFFLAFLCYLALVVWSAARRLPRLSADRRSLEGTRE
ncbi:lycopene cyclase domain-containing protein [Microbacterium sp. zg.B48]|uniref:lycopene cyclase domain-containing protein n=1 Tax=unclassified Microbacterium TaxID=2609290 RepID=UPI00214B0E3C|nr:MULTISPECIES: lycopene cyclase domain-containing protein [unclassified Microbacterium]MCR2762197.1 lycopene cyclase domain-containing protein [Microbacterium sp. zg.B48]MCR2809796.1 lycopene cyclase domain-containing protein [Microbacterium sp. zg.B185]WIM17893.1 lycopene cyclase domain-containing protein [Microbacterium sp. zg-B185]